MELWLRVNNRSMMTEFHYNNIFLSVGLRGEPRLED